MLQAGICPRRLSHSEGFFFARSNVIASEAKQSFWSGISHQKIAASLALLNNELKPEDLFRFVMPAQAGIQRTKPTEDESGSRPAPG